MLMPRIVKSLFWRQTHRQTSEFSFFGAPKPRQSPPTQGKNGRLIAFCTPVRRALVATRHAGCAPIAALDSDERWNNLEHTMNKSEKLADLRNLLAHYSLPPDRPAISLGFSVADAVLGGGLRRGAVHEVFADDWGAGGFAACLALRAAG